MYSGIMESFSPEALELITSHHSLSIATYSDERQRPQVATIYYVFLDDELYVVAHSTTSKVKNILSNGKLALVITDENTPKTLQIEGRGEIITDPDRMQRVMIEYQRITEEVAKNAPVMEVSGNTMVVIAVSIIWFRFTNYSEKLVEQKL